MVSRARGIGWRLPVVGLAVLAVALASFAAGVALRDASAQPTAQTIYACKGDRSGTLRVVSEGQPCLRGESPLSWSTQGDLTPSITGSIEGNGSIFVGNGFTAERTGVGVYVITFPAGTWTNVFIPTVTTTGGVAVGGLSFGISPDGDGSGEMTVLLFNDAFFTFNATQVAP